MELTASRTLDMDPVEKGEKVNVLIYKVFMFDDKKAYVVENSAMMDKNPIFI